MLQGVIGGRAIIARLRFQLVRELKLLITSSGTSGVSLVSALDSTGGSRAEQIEESYRALKYNQMEKRTGEVSTLTTPPASDIYIQSRTSTCIRCG